MNQVMEGRIWLSIFNTVRQNLGNKYSIQTFSYLANFICFPGAGNLAGD